MTSRISLAAAALVAVLSLSACGSTAQPQAPQPSSPAADTTPKATITAGADDEPSTPAPGAEPECETIVSAGTVDALTSQGWTFKQEEFRIGETLVSEGLLCMWADFTTASDHGQMYAWGLLGADASRTAQAGLQRDGWLRSEEEGETYFTEDPAYAIATDEDGYGMTYEFGDGWVKFADTKQGLLLIEWDE
ncbi:hypothetical protein ACFWHT_06350 [Microbacterium sp. NPDC058342]|uniref:hypothetical protein n=1 Tax=Microbacterium sp. NPDC058342 TaxID=3346454 RepID=UPI0036468C5D